MAVPDVTGGRIRVELPDPLEGERVDRVVSLLTGCSRRDASAAVEGGTVLLDGAVARRAAQRVRAGQVLEVLSDPARADGPPLADPSVQVEVVYEDEEVIVVDKPAGLVVHPGAGTKGATLVNGLLARFPDLEGVGGDPSRPGIVHRLDKGTSGLMVVARTPAAFESLVGQLAGHSVERRYNALVWGAFETPTGTIDAPVGRSRRDPLKMTVTAEGRPARTHYRVLESFVHPVPTVLLDCSLETGRTHQIRVHLRSIGRPVVGDDVYGGARQAIPMGRPFLHARALTFTHPASGTEARFDRPLPPDLREVMSRLG